MEYGINEMCDYGATTIDILEYMGYTPEEIAEIMEPIA